MKIGIYDPYLDTMSGGERYMLSMVRCLQTEHDVSLFWEPGDKDSIVQEAKRRFAMDLSEITFTKSLFTPDTPFLKRWQKSREYDLIIVLSDGSIPLIQCPLILHFQTPAEWVRINPIVNTLKFMRVQTSIVNSNYTKKYVDAKYGITSQILYPPVDLPKVKETSKEHLILNVGRFGIRNAGSSFKKQEALRDAFKKLHDTEKTDWKMVFIMTVADAEKDVLDTFLDSVKNYPIQVVVNPDLKTVEEYYGRASIYWHGAGYGEDLEMHPDRAEHFGITTVEAMHYGAVPIVIDAGGQPEIVTDGENGYLWKTEAELLEKTHKVMRDSSLRKKIAEQAHTRAKYFGVDRFCRELGTLL